MAHVAIKSEVKGERLDDDDGDLADIPGFEEDIDLQFPPTHGAGGSAPTAWFAKVPSELWQSWHKIYEAAPEGVAGGAPTHLVLGKMRVYNIPEGGQEKDRQIEITLSQDVPDTRKLPQKYTVKLQHVGYNNTVVFSEKDLAGHSTPAFGRSRHVASRTAGVNKNDRYSKKTGYQSAIPKQTSLMSPIHQEAVVTAQVDAKDFFESLEATLAPSDKVNFDLRADGPARKAIRSGLLSSFTTTSKPKGKKKPKEKAVRMSQDQLYAAIYRCFSEWRYWRLGQLRRTLNQPEAFIKQTLEQVAHLYTKGDFAGCWELKPEYAQMQNIDMSRVKNEENKQIESGAEEGTDAGTGDEVDDDDFGDLEDVKMEGT